MVSSWLAAVGSQWKLSVCLCRSGKLCSIQAYSFKYKQLVSMIDCVSETGSQIGYKIVGGISDNGNFYLRELGTVIKGFDEV